MIPIHAYDGRRVAVFGLGRSGIAAAKALEAGGAKVSAWDDSEAGRKRAEAEGLSLEDLNRRDWGDIDALVLSPGIPLTHPKPHHMVELAKAVGAPVIGDIELFAHAINEIPEKRRPKIIGVTGTNGKSTTTALIGHILKETGRNVHIGGNIGEAILTLETPRPGAIYVLELSSYQIDLTKNLHCDIALMLNISPDHLDRHGGFDGYFFAKERLFEMQDDTGKAVIGIDDEETAALYTRLRRERGEEQVVPVSSGRVLVNGAYGLGGQLYDAMDGASHPVADLNQALALPGKHNAQNAASALAVVRMLGVGASAAAKAISSFTGMPHRQEMVAEFQGVRFINDSKATNVDAACQALNCYDTIYWIAGGRAKDESLQKLENCHGRIAKAFLIGEAESGFAKELEGKIDIEACGDLKTAFERASQAAFEDSIEGAVVLLSPAAASFDQFDDFEARGDAFKAMAQALVSTPESVS